MLRFATIGYGFSAAQNKGRRKAVGECESKREEDFNTLM